MIYIYIYIFTQFYKQNVYHDLEVMCMLKYNFILKRINIFLLQPKAFILNWIFEKGEIKR